MKTVKMTWKLQATAIVLSLWLAAGCANKTNVAENEQVDGFSETAENSAENATEEATTAEAEIFGEQSETGAATDPGAAPTETASTDAATGTDATADTLFSAESGAKEPSIDELAAKSGQDAASAEASSSMADAAAGTDPALTADPLLAAGGTTALQDPATPSEAQAFEPKPTYAGAVLPNIPGRAITRKGVSLNRYYFLRQGDTAASVSELLYGDTSHAASLKKWNKGTWTPGKVIYYSSTTQPDDAQMISFYDERSLTPEEHQVSAGETMSTIAKKVLGNRASWKEIAIVNGLTQPDALKRGQSIKIFKNLNSSTLVASQPEQNIEVPTPTPTPQPEVAPPTVAQVPPAALGAPADPAVPPADDLDKPKKKPAKPSLNLGKIVQQNSFGLAMGLGVGLLLIALLMINKRKRNGSSADDFSEDAFSAPEKKRRR